CGVTVSSSLCSWAEGPRRAEQGPAEKERGGTARSAVRVRGPGPRLLRPARQGRGRPGRRGEGARRQRRRGEERVRGRGDATGEGAGRHLPGLRDPQLWRVGQAREGR